MVWVGVRRKRFAWLAIVVVIVVVVIAWYTGVYPVARVEQPTPSPGVVVADKHGKTHLEEVDWKSFYGGFKLCPGLEYCYVQSNPVHNEKVFRFPDRRYFSRVVGEELFEGKPVWRLEVEISTLDGEALAKNVVWVSKESNKCLKQVVIGSGGVKEMVCSPVGYTAWQTLASQANTVWKPVGKETLVFGGETIEVEVVEVYRLEKLHAKLWATMELSVPLMIQFYSETGEPHTVMRLESYRGCGREKTGVS